jgi:glycogen operon protein
MTDQLGATILPEGIRFAVRSATASSISVSIFDGDKEAAHELTREGDIFSAIMPGLGEGTRYGFRADGDYDPSRGLWFDPAKLLTDPYAVEIDQPYVYDKRLAARRGEGEDTASLMPKAVARKLEPFASSPPLFQEGGLIYEVPVRAFTMLHPEIPKKLRGTIAALANPAIIKHLKKLGVSAVELMPITAWIDERHLPPLGLTNAWGYNPVSFMALDPRLAPGGLQELRDTVAALREAGIGVILDLVFNHTGESDAQGPTLSLRGLDNPAYYRHATGKPDTLVNDTGTGNTLACDHPAVRQLVLDSLRHFVRYSGVDGFRFDLASILGRTASGFDPNACLLEEMRHDEILGDRVLIAEPWDIGPGGYQLGRFPDAFLEWNDKYRDDVRRFWRGDPGMIGRLATRLAGSSDVFGGEGRSRTRTVNFIAAHDGMTLADITAFEHKHNEANGEENRDGHGDNISWNNGVEGATDDAKILNHRDNDRRALLATLFASRGTIMLTAGDESGRTQRGNNNAYAQDNEIAWLDWEGRDIGLEDFAARLSRLRAGSALAATEFLSEHDVAWLTETGAPMSENDWNDAECRRFTMLMPAFSGTRGGRFAILVNGDHRAASFSLPLSEGLIWRVADTQAGLARGSILPVHGRSIALAVERK